jgi:hypothetical protein
MAPATSGEVAASSCGRMTRGREGKSARDGAKDSCADSRGWVDGSHMLARLTGRSGPSAMAQLLRQLAYRAQDRRARGASHFVLWLHVRKSSSSSHLCAKAGFFLPVEKKSHPRKNAKISSDHHSIYFSKKNNNIPISSLFIMGTGIFAQELGLKLHETNS